MDEEIARRILGITIQPDNSLYNEGQYIAWPVMDPMGEICLDSVFSFEELEAIVWWLRNKTIIE